MLSIFVPVRSNPGLTTNCLVSLQQSCRQLFADAEVEYLFVDNSESGQDIPRLFADFRTNTQSSVRVLRFTQRREYVLAFSAALSLARGSSTLLVSNDMMVTPAYIRTLLAVAAMDERIGIVRGTSQHTDSHPEHLTPPPESLPLRSYEDVARFSELVAGYHGLRYTDDRLLAGDSLLIRRGLIERIGVLDTSFIMYFGDVDYGIRALRTGFRLVCAKGAWLHHVGAGYVKTEAAEQGVSPEVAHAARMRRVQAAYETFRAKWNPSLPPQYTDVRDMNLEGLNSATAGPELRVPPLDLAQYPHHLT